MASLGSKTKRIQRRSALFVAYNALMSIGCVDPALHPSEWCIARVHQIVGEALTELNLEHTREVQKVLGIGGKRV